MDLLGTLTPALSLEKGEGEKGLKTYESQFPLSTVLAGVLTSERLNALGQETCINVARPALSERPAPTCMWKFLDRLTKELNIDVDIYFFVLYTGIIRSTYCLHNNPLDWHC